MSTEAVQHKMLRECALPLDMSFWSNYTIYLDDQPLDGGSMAGRTVTWKSCNEYEMSTTNSNRGDDDGRIKDQGALIVEPL